MSPFFQYKFQSRLFLFVASLFLSTVIFFGAAMAEESAYDDNEDTGANPMLVLPAVQDLAALGKISRSKGVPILLMYSTEDCNHCKRLESDVLGPMRLTGIDPKEVIVRKVMVAEYEILRLFSGKKRNAESYAMEQNVNVVPTVALVDENGKDLVPKIVGYNTPGIYDAYLEEAIKVSRALLKQR